MRNVLRVVVLLFIPLFLFGQTHEEPPKVKVMTLGVFHFAYPNLDAVKTERKDQISVLDEPYKTEIEKITEALLAFHPTIIAVEAPPEKQFKTDSLFRLYQASHLELGKNETEQLGFRLAKMLNIEKVYCVDNMGRAYENVRSMFEDSLRSSKLDEFYARTPDSVYFPPRTNKKIASIIDALIESNDPERVKNSLGTYLLRLFKYEETPGDFFGVDFESGRWFNRNLRIFRNIQRIPRTPDDRILQIIGSGHLSLLNHLFEVSKEFELVSPIPFLLKAKGVKN